MAYRPQFAYEPPPPGWIDEDFEYVFDQFNTPALAVPLFPGDVVLNVPLRLETGNEYRVRSIEVIDPTGGFAVRFRDAAGVRLTPDSYLPDAFIVRSGAAVSLEPGLTCPAGSLLQADIERVF